MKNFYDYLEAVRIAQEIINEGENNDLETHGLHDTEPFAELISDYYGLFHAHKEDAELSKKVVELKKLINLSISSYKKASEMCDDFYNGEIYKND